MEENEKQQFSIKEWQKRTNYKGIGSPVKKAFNKFETNKIFMNSTNGFCKQQVKKRAERYAWDWVFCK